MIENHFHFFLKRANTSALGLDVDDPKNRELLGDVPTTPLEAAMRKPDVDHHTSISKCPGPETCRVSRAVHYFDRRHFNFELFLSACAESKRASRPSQIQ